MARRPWQGQTEMTSAWPRSTHGGLPDPYGTTIVNATPSDAVPVKS